jgi:hypothetical protein
MFASWTKAILLKIYFRNLAVQRSFLQYKSQYLEKVNVKYVIKRLWHEIVHIVPGINPRPISALQLRCRIWHGSLGLIPGPIWKMSWNNLLILTLKQKYNYRLIHGHFHIGLVIIPRPPYWPEKQLRANMGRGMITGPIWKCPCIKLFITYFQHLEKRHPYWSETKSIWK